MSAHQTKTLEMEAQVHLLKLESEVSASAGCLSGDRWQQVEYRAHTVL